MSRSALFADAIRGSALAGAVADPQRLLDSAEARFLKDHLRTAVARVRIGERDVYVKRFKPYAWYRRVGAALSATPARTSWENARRLERAGFFVPAPLAMVEDGADSYFVTEAVPGAEPAADWWLRTSDGLAPALRRRIVRSAARTLRRFHDSGLYSRDTNANNFLLRLRRDGETEFFFLDLENVRPMRRVGRRRRVKNLVQLYRILRGRFSARDRLRFLLFYLGCHLPLGPAERGELRGWLDDLGRLDLRKESEYQARARRQRRRGAHAEVGVTPPRPRRS
ncbi:MAG: lipopolysaccharide kinase InaA family protein [Candidatus Binatia bacterium]